MTFHWFMFPSSDPAQAPEMCQAQWMRQMRSVSSWSLESSGVKRIHNADPEVGRKRVTDSELGEGDDFPKGNLGKPHQRPNLTVEMEPARKDLGKEQSKQNLPETGGSWCLWGQKAEPCTWVLVHEGWWDARSHIPLAPQMPASWSPGPHRRKCRFPGSTPHLLF